MNLHNKKILLIEDDKHVFALIKAMLKPYNVDIVMRSDGKSGLKIALKEKFHLILLDIMLPEKDGWQICRELQNKKPNTPIIIITAKVEETDKVLGLEIGADDYVTKPFSPRELIARIKAVLRRYEKTLKENDKSLYFDNIDLTINIAAYEIKFRKETINLTPKEFELLAFLAKNREQVFKREQLLDKIWGFDNYTETRTIDEHIKRIRKKLSEASLKQNLIKTIWGVGYKFSLEED